MDKFILFEALLWIVLFILLLLVLRAALKACCPKRAVFRSSKDDKRKRREEEDEEMEEEEEDDEMMKPEKATANGQSEARNGRASGVTESTEAEWESQTTAATRNVAPRPTQQLGAAIATAGDAAGDGAAAAAETEGAAQTTRRRREDGDGGLSKRPRWPEKRLAVEALIVAIFTILVAYFCMLGVFALVYYLFESDFLYGNAVVCPAMASEKCSRNDKDVACCDYSFEFDDVKLSRESRFVGVPAASPSSALAARVHLWLVHADGGGEFYDAKRPKYLIYTHGNIDNLSFDKRLYKFLAKDLGLNVVAWDYPGFGKSQGTPSEALIHESMAAVFQWLVDEKSVDRKDIILWGYSLGGEVTTKIANRFPGIMGVILQAPIDSSLSVVRASLPLTGWAYIAAITQPYDTCAEIKNLNSCLFLFVGANDDTMEPYRMQSLYRRAQGTNPSCREYLEIPSLNHLSNPLDSPKFIHKLRLYLNKIINMSN